MTVWTGCWHGAPSVTTVWTGCWDGAPSVTTVGTGCWNGALVSPRVGTGSGGLASSSGKGSPGVLLIIPGDLGTQQRIQLVTLCDGITEGT